MNNQEQNACVDELTKMFDQAHIEILEDGMHEMFNHHLKHIIDVHGNEAIHALEKVIRTTPTVNIDVVEESLKQISNMDDIATHDSRFSLLNNKLMSHHPRVRNAALIGIKGMGDARAMDNIHHVIDNEKDKQVCEDFQNVLEYLLDDKNKLQ